MHGSQCYVRCTVHDLAAAPDGCCVLCRRTAAPPSSPRIAPFVFGGMAALLLTGVAYRVASARAARSDEVSVASATPSDSTAKNADSVPVVVYTTPWCPACKRAKAWMSGEGIAFEERDVEASRENAGRMHSINPRGSVPTFAVGGEVLVGFRSADLIAAMRRAANRSGASLPP